jgi:hypothetical protein
MDIDEPDNPDAFQIKDMNEYIKSWKKVKINSKDGCSVKAGIEIGLQDWTLRQASAIASELSF